MLPAEKRLARNRPATTGSSSEPASRSRSRDRRKSPPSRRRPEAAAGCEANLPGVSFRLYQLSSESTTRRISPDLSAGQRYRPAGCDLSDSDSDITINCNRQPSDVGSGQDPSDLENLSLSVSEWPLVIDMLNSLGIPGFGGSVDAGQQD
jgi:hypothetical protein